MGPLNSMGNGAQRLVAQLRLAIGNGAVCGRRPAFVVVEAWPFLSVPCPSSSDFFVRDPAAGIFEVVTLQLPTVIYPSRIEEDYGRRKKA